MHAVDASAMDFGSTSKIGGHVYCMHGAVEIQKATKDKMDRE